MRIRRFNEAIYRPMVTDESELQDIIQILRNVGDNGIKIDIKSQYPLGSDAISSSISLINNTGNDQDFIKSFEEVYRRLETLGIIKESRIQLCKIKDNPLKRGIRKFIKPNNWDPGLEDVRDITDSFFAIKYQKVINYSTKESPNFDTMVYYIKTEDYDSFIKFDNRVNVSIEYGSIITEILPCDKLMELI